MGAFYGCDNLTSAEFEKNKITDVWMYTSTLSSTGSIAISPNNIADNALAAKILRETEHYRIELFVADTPETDP